MLGIGDGHVNSMREADVYNDSGQLTQRGGRSLSSGVVGACHAIQIASNRGGNLDFGKVAQRILIPEGFATGAAVAGCAPPFSNPLWLEAALPIACACRARVTG